MHDLEVPHKVFAKRLKDLCREADIPLTQAGIAKLFETSGASASYYLNGLRLPSMDRARSVAGKLNCCVEYLLTGRGPMRPGPEQTADHDNWVYIGHLSERDKTLVQAIVKPESDDHEAKKSSRRSA